MSPPPFSLVSQAFLSWFVYFSLRNCAFLFIFQIGKVYMSKHTQIHTQHTQEEILTILAVKKHRSASTEPSLLTLVSSADLWLYLVLNKALIGVDFGLCSFQG